MSSQLTLEGVVFFTLVTNVGIGEFTISLDMAATVPGCQGATVHRGGGQPTVNQACRICSRLHLMILALMLVTRMALSDI